MISRIETIDDLIMWIDSLIRLNTKNVKIEKLPEDQATALISAQEVLSKIGVRFPGPFKQCVTCKAIWPETREWFDWCGQGRTGLHAECKFCRNAYQKKYQEQRRAKQSNFGYASQADLDEINFHREQDGLPPLSTAPAKKGRPRRSKTKKSFTPQYIPKVGERW